MPAMAATQQPPKQAKHPKQPSKQAPRKVKGNDFLAKMLQLEKQSNHQRSASSSPPHGHIKPPPVNGTLNHQSPTIATPVSPPTSPNRQAISPPVSPPMRQGQFPPPVTDPKLAKDPVKPAPLRVETKNIPQETVQSELCLSPTWSDHGERDRQKEKKRQEREQKEQRRKHEEENRQPPKRLSKKPPAAMDTQKMPAELRKPRRNSLLSFVPSRSSSRERSQERSKGEKRNSTSSITSFMTGRRSNSASRQPTLSPEEKNKAEPESPQSWKPVVNPVPPRLPSLRFGHKKSSTAQGKSGSPGAEEESDGELLAFPYGSSRPITEKLPESPKKQSCPPTAEAEKNKSLQTMEKPVDKPSTIPPTPKTSSEAKKKHDESKLRSEPRRGIEVLPSPPKPWTDQPQRNKPHQKSDEVAAELIAMLSEQKLRSYQHKTSPTSPEGTNAPTRDGGSYVHKQRMYQQQRSIAGFQEQEALQIFHDQAALGESQSASKGVQPASINGTVLPTQRPRSRSSSPSRAPPSGTRSRSGSRSASLPRTSNTLAKRQSVSPSGKASMQPTQTALSPLKQVSSAPDDSSEEQQSQKANQGKEHISEPNQAKKSDKFLGFRRRTREIPAPISIEKVNGHPPEEKKKSSLDQSHEHETAPKQSRRNRISSHIPFTRHRADSSGSQVAVTNAPSPDAGRGNSKTRATSQVPPSPASVTEETRSRMIEQALEQKKSSSESNSTRESKDEAKTADKPSPKRPKAKASQNSEQLAAAYGELIHSTSSEESIYHDASEIDEANESAPASKTSNKKRAETDTTLTRPRSNPQLHKQNLASQSLPSLDFLPQLKHQPLTRNPRRSHQSSGENSPTRIHVPKPTPHPDTAYKSPLSSPPDLAFLPRSPLRSSSNLPALIKNQSATSIASLSSASKNPAGEGPEVKPIGKLFVICCKCKFWHDLPSKLYEAMALPKELHRNDDATEAPAGKGKGDKGEKSTKVQPGGKKVASARLETAVKCPWCEHPMTTACCAGWTTVVYMHERHH